MKEESVALHVIDWREELANFQERYDSLGKFGRDYCILREEIKTVLDLPLSVIHTADSIFSAYSILTSDDCEFGLVQDTPDTIQGVLSREVAQHFCESSASDAETVSVSSIMDRKICIEPEAASVREVMDRMTKGACACTVVVSANGHPRFIVSPKTLFFTLTESVPDVVTISPRLRAQGML